MRLLNKIVDSKCEMYSMNKKTSYNLSRSASTKFIPSSAPSTPSWPKPASSFLLQKSHSITDVETQRGFKPSDCKDPQKKAFLKNLTQKVFKVGLVS